MTRPLARLGFLHIVPFRRDAPAEGLEDALRLFEYGEALGFDVGWVRTRHIQYGIPSAPVFLAAAAQRTRAMLAEALETGKTPAVIAERRAWARVHAARDRSRAVDRTAA